MSSKSSKEIQKHREAIDRIDQDLLKLLSDRGRMVVQIGKFKKALQSQFYVPEREENILNRLKGLNRGPFGGEAIQTIFREILSASLALESPLKVAYLGPEATFTHLAGIKRFGLSAQFVPQPSIQKVFQEVVLRRGGYGIVPI